ncbi:MAG: M23 family metallopeptidase [Bacteroidia bacterium]
MVVDQGNKIRCEDLIPRMASWNDCGRVATKFNDREKRNMRTIELTNGTSITAQEYSMEFWDAVDVGDSIYKEAGSMVYFIVKRDTTITVELKCEALELYDQSESVAVEDHNCFFKFREDSICTSYGIVGNLGSYESLHLFHDSTFFWKWIDYGKQYYASCGSWSTINDGVQLVGSKDHYFRLVKRFDEQYPLPTQKAPFLYSRFEYVGVQAYLKAHVDSLCIEYRKEQDRVSVKEDALLVEFRALPQHEKKIEVKGGSVKALMSGQVYSVHNLKDGWSMVSVKHVNGISWYTPVKDVSLKKFDWVEEGTVIGTGGDSARISLYDYYHDFSW